jgi:ribonuclease BN (tRNA processing enzyme)
MPVFGDDFIKCAGNTPSVFIPIDDKKCLIIDGGTGIFSMNKHQNFEEFHLFFTHLHWDHIMGLPMFNFFYRADKKVIIHVQEKAAFEVENFLDVLFNPPFFPVPRNKLLASIEINLLKGKEVFNFNKIMITSMIGNHPDGSLIYKIVDDNKSMIFATDYEHGTRRDEELIDFAYNTDFLVYDTAYLPDDYEGLLDSVPKKGYGHSTYVDGTDIAMKAKVKNFVLYHYSPNYSDEDILKMGEMSKKIFTNTLISYDNMILK